MEDMLNGTILAPQVSYDQRKEILVRTMDSKKNSPEYEKYSRVWNMFRNSSEQDERVKLCTLYIIHQIHDATGNYDTQFIKKVADFVYGFDHDKLKEGYTAYDIAFLWTEGQGLSSKIKNMVKNAAYPNEDCLENVLRTIIVPFQTFMRQAINFGSEAEAAALTRLFMLSGRYKELGRQENGYIDEYEKDLATFSNPTNESFISDRSFPPFPSTARISMMDYIRDVYLQIKKEEKKSTENVVLNKFLLNLAVAYSKGNFRDDEQTKNKYGMVTSGDIYDRYGKTAESQALVGKLKGPKIDAKGMHELLTGFQITIPTNGSSHGSTTEVPLVQRNVQTSSTIEELLNYMELRVKTSLLRLNIEAEEQQTNYRTIGETGITGMALGITKSPEAMDPIIRNIMRIITPLLIGKDERTLPPNKIVESIVDRIQSKYKEDYKEEYFEKYFSEGELPQMIAQKINEYSRSTSGNIVLTCARVVNAIVDEMIKRKKRI